MTSTYPFRHGECFPTNTMLLHRHGEGSSVWDIHVGRYRGKTDKHAINLN